MPDENSQRMNRLESHLAHLEHQVKQWNGVVIEQGKLLDRLSKETQRQSGAVQTLEPERMKSNMQQQPHYQGLDARPTTGYCIENPMICHHLSNIPGIPCTASRWNASLRNWSRGMVGLR
jgi:uncharacterized coiled-coil protein SlyX